MRACWNCHVSFITLEMWCLVTMIGNSNLRWASDVYEVCCHLFLLYLTFCHRHGNYSGIRARRRLSLKPARSGPMIWARRPSKITSTKWFVTAKLSVFWFIPRWDININSKSNIIPCDITWFISCSRQFTLFVMWLGSKFRGPAMINQFIGYSSMSQSNCVQSQAWYIPSLL